MLLHIFTGRRQVEDERDSDQHLDAHSMNVELEKSLLKRDTTG